MTSARVKIQKINLEKIKRFPNSGKENFKIMQIKIKEPEILIKNK
jgi:hypothetical protein